MVTDPLACTETFASTTNPAGGGCAAFDTVTVTATDVALLPDESVATAES